MTNRSSPATTINEEPIYDQVPCEATAIIQRTETIYERIPNQTNPPPNNNSQTNNTIARPKFRPPPPVPEPEGKDFKNHKCKLFIKNLDNIF